jgi:phosphatidylglycerophosphate synthase
MKFTPEDIATIPNAITAVGLALTLHGSGRLDTVQGITETGVGKALDVVDGIAARSLGQFSEFGAALDATSDKVGSLAIIVGEWRKGVAPKPVLAAILAQNAVNAAMTMGTARKNPNVELITPKNGKHAQAAQNLAVGSYALGSYLHETGHIKSGKALRYIGHSAAAIGVGYLGMKATYTYIQRFRQA